MIPMASSSNKNRLSSRSSLLSMVGRLVGSTSTIFFCLFLHASSLSLYLVIRGTATKFLIASHIRITTLSYGWVYSINGFFCQIGRWIKESSDLSQEEIWRRSCLLYWMYRDLCNSSDTPWTVTAYGHLESLRDGPYARDHYVFVRSARWTRRPIWTVTLG